MNTFKAVRANKFTSVILADVTGINLSQVEVDKLKVFLRYEAQGQLFSSIESIYQFIGANFTKPSKFIIIPFINNGNEHINIQKL